MILPLVMYGYESWTIKKAEQQQKNWYIQIVVLKTFENPLGSNEIKQLSSKGNQPWMSTERTEAEAPILWPSDAKSQHIGKDPDPGKDWKQMQKRVAEDEMIR